MSKKIYEDEQFPQDENWDEIDEDMSPKNGKDLAEFEKYLQQAAFNLDILDEDEYEEDVFD